MSSDLVTCGARTTGQPDTTKIRGFRGDFCGSEPYFILQRKPSGFYSLNYTPYVELDVVSCGHLNLVATWVSSLPSSPTPAFITCCALERQSLPRLDFPLLLPSCHPGCRTAAPPLLPSPPAMLVQPSFASEEGGAAPGHRQAADRRPLRGPEA